MWRTRCGTLFRAGGDSEDAVSAGGGKGAFCSSLQLLSRMGEGRGSGERSSLRFRATQRT